jgi:hypothetical protein
MLKKFSGPTTGDLFALDRALVDARRARVTRGGFLVYAVDPDADVLAPDTEKFVSILGEDVIAESQDAADLAALREALLVREITGSICMCAGDLAIEFVDDRRRPVEVVRIDLPNAIEWPMWPGRVELANPERLQTWLAAHGL